MSCSRATSLLCSLCAAAVLAVAVAACDSAPRAHNPGSDKPRAPTEAEATAAEAPSGETAAAGRDELLALIDSVETFARVNMGFAVTERINTARTVVTGWAEDQGLREPTIDVVGVRSGHPAFVVSQGDGSLRRGVIVIDDEVLDGEAGFRRFVTELEPRRNALRWASAWLVLIENVASEPLGTWSKPVDTPPRFDDTGLLDLSWQRADGGVQSARVEISAEGQVRTRARRP